jgi:hypothetical protein
MEDVPKPSASFGRWRQQVVNQHSDRGKAATKQAELEDRLREGGTDENGNTSR